RKNSKKPTINEFAFIHEMIRFNTFTANRNMLFYASKLGEEAAMVDDPDPRQLNYQIGPIARRILLYFSRHRPGSIQELISFMTGPDDAGTTAPVLVNRNRN